jgi:hypothetical protein
MGRARRSEDQRPDWIERERNACAEPKGRGCAERVAGVFAEREAGGCAGREAARARLFASYRPSTHPVAAPNIVGQRPARSSPRDDMPRPMVTTQCANNSPFDAPFSFSRSRCNQPDADGADPELRFYVIHPYLRAAQALADSIPSARFRLALKRMHSHVQAHRSRLRRP